MSTTQSVEWSPQEAKAIEGWLTQILTSIKGVKNIKGVSYEGYKDFKVLFDFDNGEVIVNGCFLCFAPDGGAAGYKGIPLLEAWTGGLSFRWPKPVVTEIIGMFPKSIYAPRESMGADKWHYWLGISLSDLESVAQSLAK